MEKVLSQSTRTNSLSSRAKSVAVEGMNKDVRRNLEGRLTDAVRYGKLSYVEGSDHYARLHIGNWQSDSYDAIGESGLVDGVPLFVASKKNYGGCVIIRGKEEITDSYAGISQVFPQGGEMFYLATSRRNDKLFFMNGHTQISEEYRKVGRVRYIDGAPIFDAQGWERAYLVSGRKILAEHIGWDNVVDLSMHSTPQKKPLYVLMQKSCCRYEFWDLCFNSHPGMTSKVFWGDEQFGVYRTIQELKFQEGRPLFLAEYVDRQRQWGPRAIVWGSETWEVDYFARDVIIFDGKPMYKLNGCVMHGQDQVSKTHKGSLFGSIAGPISVHDGLPLFIAQEEGGWAVMHGTERKSAVFASGQIDALKWNVGLTFHQGKPLFRVTRSTEKKKSESIVWGMEELDGYEECSVPRVHEEGFSFYALRGNSLTEVTVKTT